MGELEQALVNKIIELMDELIKTLQLLNNPIVLPDGSINSRDIGSGETNSD